MNTWTRRQFLTATASAAAFVGLSTHAVEPAPHRKLKLGVIGNGGRGSWIAKLFQQHGGYDMHAVADYFPEVARQCGDALGVDPARRFSGLSGYRKLMASGVEAVALETPPYFLPEHARVAVEAGLHVYMAKPVAVDVPGCLAIEAAAQRAAKQLRVFLVDYQMPTDPINIEVVKRIRAGGLGKLVQVQSIGYGNGFSDPPKTATLESRLQHLIWVNDVAMGCDYIGNFDIHAIDAALWVIGQRPISAVGSSRIARPDPHGDSRDVCAVVFEYADGLVHNHIGQSLKNNNDSVLAAIVNGQTANAQINYWGKAFLRGGDKHFGGGPVKNLYEAGAVRNIAAFHEAVTRGDCSNPTVPRAVDSCLTCILGREAAARGAKLTMAKLLKENRKLDVDLKGLRT